MKRLSSEATINLLAAAVIVAFGAWLIYATEWVDIWQPTPPRGEAARDPHYAIKQIAGKLGAKVVSPDNLDRLPPPGATLVLDASEWDFVPGRSQRLRAWVEQGGHLVLPSFTMTGARIEWVPLQQVQRKRNDSLSCSVPRDDSDDEDDDEDTEDRADKKPAPPPDARLRLRYDPLLVGPRNDPRQQCPVLAEPTAEGADSDRARRYRVCNSEWWPSLEPKAGVAASWSLSGDKGVPMLRAPLGQGRVTALGAYGFLNNHAIFSGDHALAAVTAFDLRPGGEIWFVLKEERDALLLWLWHRAGPAIALALLALALVLWRGALRFGPMLPTSAPVRRSVAEQIRGTAAFVWRGGGAALVAAARRALDEAARSRIAGWDRMTMAERIAALQPPTALPPELLTRALDPQLPWMRGIGRGHALADKLALLEQARRRLLLNDNRSARGKDPDHVAQPR